MAYEWMAKIRTFIRWYRIEWLMLHTVWVGVLIWMFYQLHEEGAL